MARYAVNKKVISILLLWLIPMWHLYAQEERYDFRHIGVHHEVTSIIKDSRGFLWIATISGLHRFDGYSARSFLHDARDTSSLVSNLVKQLFETPDHRLGVRTITGMMLYDPETERFDKNLDSFHAQYGTSNELKNIVRDRSGAFWFVEPRQIIKYTPADKKLLTFKSIAGDSTSISADSIADLAVDNKGAGWIVYRNGILEKIEVVNGRGQVTRRIHTLSTVQAGRRYSYKIFADADGDLWLSVPIYSLGVFYIQTGSGKLSHFTTHSETVRLNSNHISGFTQAKNGLIWVGTDHGGVNMIDKTTWNVSYLLHHEEDSRTLAENSVKYLYRDDEDIIWVGTFKRGISYYHEGIKWFDVYKTLPHGAGSLPYGDINRFTEDNKGNLWIGTNGGGLLYFDRHQKTFTQYRNTPGDDTSLCGDVIVSLCTDSDGILWIGTYNHGMCRFDGKRFTSFQYKVNDTTSIPSQNVWEIFEDSQKRLWVGTLENGVALLDRKTGKFHRLKVGGENAIQSPFIFSITEDHQGNIWFGTVYGIDVLAGDGRTFTHYGASSDQNSLGSITSGI